MAKAIEQTKGGLTVGHAGFGEHGAGIGSTAQSVHDGDTRRGAIGALLIAKLLFASALRISTPSEACSAGGCGVEVFPSRVTLTPGASQEFRAIFPTPWPPNQYRWQFVTNASGGSLTGATYVAGLVGEVVDVIEVTDARGVTGRATVTVSTLAISPANATLSPRASQTFIPSGGSRAGYAWALLTNASGASLDASGVYTAGPMGDVTDVVQVSDVQGVGATVTATVTVTADLSISPSSVRLAPGARQIFTASGGSNAGYAWSLGANALGGSLSADGVYVAGPTAGVTDLVTVTDSLGNSSTAIVTVSNASTLLISPPSISLTPRSTTVFIATGGSGTGYLWEIVPNRSGGTLSHSGFRCRTGRICYTAGATGNVTDVIRVTDSSGAQATATVTVTAAVAVSPSSLTLKPGASQNFTASGGSGTGYAWAFVINASGGSLSANGEYTAGATGGVLDMVGVRDSLGILGTATVTVTGAVAVSPSSVTLEPGASQNFTASGGSGTGYAWAFVINASGGSLSANGEYTAGATGGVLDMVGVWDSLGILGTATVTVTGAVAVSPSSVTLKPRASQNFTASGGSGTGYAWAFVINASGGSLSANGEYTAGGTGGVLDMVGVRDSLGILGTATVTITAQPLTVSPTTATLAPRASQTFTASGGSGVGYTWDFVSHDSGGTLSVTGDYVAGPTGDVTDIIRLTDSLGAHATAMVTVIGVKSSSDMGCSATGGATFPMLAIAALSLLGRRRLANFGPGDRGLRFGRAILPSVSLLLVFSACGSGPESTEGTSSTSAAIDATSSRQAGGRFSRKNGRIAWSGYIPFADQAIFSAEPDGSDLRQLTFPEAGVFGDSHPNWSPDGSKIVFERDYADASVYQGVYQIFRINADGSGLTQIGDCAGNCVTDAFPNYSPDGKKVAFSRAFGPVRPDGNATEFGIVTVKTVNEKDYYTRIGVAFPLEKGGFNILFDALPTNGRVLLLPDRPRSDSSNAES